MPPVIEPRTTADPRPVSSPVSEPASDHPMLTPAPSATPRPTMNAVCELEVMAAAKIGASDEIVPSIRPTSPGCTTRNRKSRSSVKPQRWISRETSGSESLRAALDCVLMDDQRRRRGRLGRPKSR
jgi:hypothetical protein